MNISLHWRDNECNGVSNHQRLDCLLNRLFKRKSKKTSKLRVTCLYEGNPLVTGIFPSQRASNAGNVSIWWHHHAFRIDPTPLVEWLAYLCHLRFPITSLTTLGSACLKPTLYAPQLIHQRPGISLHYSGRYPLRHDLSMISPKRHDTRMYSSGTWLAYFNSLAPGSCGSHFECIIVKLIIQSNK